MKTLKTFAILTLATTFALGPVSSAWASRRSHQRHYSHHSSHHSSHGDVWGAAIGGTMLGLMLGAVAAQPARPDARPQVVVIQPPPRQGVDDAAYVRSAEMMRLKQQNDRLKWELDLLKAQQAQSDAIVNNASE